jgi:hypothetical protein
LTAIEELRMLAIIEEAGTAQVTKVLDTFVRYPQAFIF